MLLADDLRTIGLSEQLVTSVVTFLNSRTNDLHDALPDEVGRTAFGTSPASANCSSDAAAARDKVQEAINDMLAGLKGYQDTLQDMAKQTWDVDTSTEAEIKTHIARAEACVAPKFASPSVCTLPGASSSGGED